MQQNLQVKNAVIPLARCKWLQKSTRWESRSDTGIAFCDMRQTSKSKGVIPLAGREVVELGFWEGEGEGKGEWETSAKEEVVIVLIKNTMCDKSIRLKAR